MKTRTFLFAALLVFLLIFGAASPSNAVVFTNEVVLNDWLTENGTVSWQHGLPPGFSSPPAEVTSAILDIYTMGANGHNDRIRVEGSRVGTLEFSWRIHSTDFDITSFFDTWPGSDHFLDVQLRYREPDECHDGLWLSRSVLTLNYTLDPENHPTTPVPEPATMLLFGCGSLLGLALFRRGGR